MKKFLSMLQFMTRIPIPINFGFDEDFYKGMKYFPSIGLILGIIYIISFNILNYFFNDYISSIFLILTSVYLTGGLHLDGVADSFDALYSYRDKEKILEIMKDSRVGTNGLLAVYFLLTLKIIFIYTIIGIGKINYVVFMPIFSRFAVILLCYKAKNARKEGMGNLFIGKVTKEMLFVSSIQMIVFLILASQFLYRDINSAFFHFVFLIILFIFVKIYQAHAYSKIEGLTGDLLGAINEISELLYLVCVVFFNNIGFF